MGDADPRLAEYPQGVLLSRGAITPDQHDTGCHYAYLCGCVLRCTQPCMSFARAAA